MYILVQQETNNEKNKENISHLGNKKEISISKTN